MINLDLEELEILEAFENDRLTRSLNWQEKLEQHREIASATFTQNSIINSLFLKKDLRSLQKRALAEGIPYPLFISSVLHKFIVGAKWLCVVIKDNSEDAFIITAYLTDKLKQGLELWRNL